jgi:hypothetical protein
MTLEGVFSLEEKKPLGSLASVCTNSETLVRLRHFGLNLGNGWARLPMDQRETHAKDLVSRQDTERHRANQRTNQRR